MHSCNLCGYTTVKPNEGDLGSARGNTAKYLEQSFPLWRCPECKTIHSLDPVDFAEIYDGYPLNCPRPLDKFAQRTFGNLLKRLSKGGLTKTDDILDYGCGNGIFVEFLKQKGYASVEGYDPFVGQFKQQPGKQYDVVVLNDVLEHVEDPGHLLDLAAKLVRTGGLLYVGTADSAGVGSMKQLDKHLLRLHQPFHRKIITQQKLLELGRNKAFTELAVYTRSYMDTLYPGVNYRFLDEISAALGYNMDVILKPESASIVAKKPYLLFYLLAGYFFPSADEPAVLWKMAA